MGESLDVKFALKDGLPVAGILTLCYKDTLVYKYGGSDATYHNSGAMPFLMWNAISAGRQAGVTVFDLGRSDPENVGLIRFKERLGATASTLRYLRFPASPAPKWKSTFGGQIARQLIRSMPDALLIRAGRLFYRHAG
jgi:hypothetical protein